MAGVHTLSKEGIERKRGLRKFLQKLKDVTTAIAKLERLVNRIMKRRRDLPSLKDLEDIIDVIQTVDKLFNPVVQAIDLLRDIWQF